MARQIWVIFTLVTFAQAGKAQQPAFPVLHLHLNCDRVARVSAPAETGAPTSVIKVHLLITNPTDRPWSHDPNSAFDFKVLDSKGVQTEGTMLDVTNPNKAKKFDIKPGQKAHGDRHLALKGRTLEDGKLYQVECSYAGTTARASFIANATQPTELPHASLAKPLVKVVCGDHESSGVIFHYDDSGKAAYVITSGTFGPKAVCLVTFVGQPEVVRDMKPQLPPDQFIANVLLSHNGIIVASLALKERPIFFPIAERGHQYSAARHVAAGWNPQDGCTVHMVRVVENGKDALATTLAPPKDKWQGSGLLSSDGKLVGLCIGGDPSVHRGGVGHYYSLNAIHDTLKKAGLDATAPRDNRPKLR